MRFDTIAALGSAIFLFAFGTAQSASTARQEIVIGNVLVPAKDGYTAISREVAVAYFDMVNNAGGINGRSVRLISYDPENSLKRTLDLTRRLVELDKVTALFQMNPEAHGNEPYVAYKKIPQFFDARSDVKFGSSKIAPDLQGKVLGHLINELMPDSPIALLLQDEAFYYAVLTGLQAGLGQENARLKIKNVETVKDPSFNYVARLSNSKA